MFGLIRFLFYRDPEGLPALEAKALYFNRFSSVSARKRWYYRHKPDYKFKAKLRTLIFRLSHVQIRFIYFNFLRWVLVDFLRSKGRKHWGIYCYVANPGHGKTLSMVAHMERVLRECGPENVYIATNFHYKHQDMQIVHWVDMVKAAKFAIDHGKCCVIAMDEIHITFDASDWKSFPPEMLSLLSFNRKYNLQFLCSSQVFERIPKKLSAIANYVVLCHNVWELDRYFENWYFPVSDYEAKFDGKRRHASYIRTYVAGDDLYALYDTKAQVDSMVASAAEEREHKQEAFDLLFGGSGRVEGTG